MSMLRADIFRKLYWPAAGLVALLLILAYLFMVSPLLKERAKLTMDLDNQKHSLESRLLNKGDMHTNREIADLESRIADMKKEVTRLIQDLYLTPDQHLENWFDDNQQPPSSSQFFTTFEGRTQSLNNDFKTMFSNFNSNPESETIRWHRIAPDIDLADRRKAQKQYWICRKICDILIPIQKNPDNPQSKLDIQEIRSISFTEVIEEKYKPSQDTKELERFIQTIPNAPESNTIPFRIELAIRYSDVPRFIKELLYRPTPRKLFFNLRKCTVRSVYDGAVLDSQTKTLAESPPEDRKSYQRRLRDRLTLEKPDDHKPEYVILILICDVIDFNSEWLNSFKP